MKTADMKTAEQTVNTPDRSAPNPDRSIFTGVRGQSPRRDRAGDLSGPLPPPVAVVRLQLVDVGPLVALADVRLGGLVLHRVRLLRKSKSGHVTQPPQAAWSDEAREAHSVPYAAWPEEWGTIITAALLAALEKHPRGFPVPRPSDDELAASLKHHRDELAGVGGGR